MSHDLDGMEVFVAVAEAKGFRAAGERLGVTGSAVSQALSRLEARLGLALVQRTTRSVLRALSCTRDSGCTMGLSPNLLHLILPAWQPRVRPTARSGLTQSGKPVPSRSWRGGRLNPAMMPLRGSTNSIHA